jgi:hypothetical protein
VPPARAVPTMDAAEPTDAEESDELE